MMPRLTLNLLVLKLQMLPSHHLIGETKKDFSVKDQGSCGSFWAFSTVANLEGLYAAKKGAIKTFFEQILCDCDTLLILDATGV